MASEVAGARARARFRWLGWLRWRLASARPSQRTRVVAFGVVASIIATLHILSPGNMPLLTFAPCVVIAGMFLAPGPLAVFYGYIGVLLTVAFIQVPPSPTRAATVLFSMGLGMVAMYSLSTSRSRVGMFWTSGHQMLLDLRERADQFAKLPPLPESYRAESALVGAHGDAFSGDVLISSTGFHPGHIEIALIDVSGKGLRAGPRGLMVASAFSGLLGQVEPERFLAAANSYLVRQSWREGFATAVHFEFDPATDRFWISSAGHPPAMRCSTVTGRWTPVLGQPGPALGIMDGVPFPRMEGVIHPGDAFVLYTDGVIETRTGELLDGIDWMGGAAERALQTGFEGLAAQLCQEALGGHEDDRGAVVLWKL